MQRLALTMTATVWVLLLDALAFGQVGVGTMVVPKDTDAPLKAGDRIVCYTYDLYWPCQVEKVNGNWLWIGDTKFHGWVEADKVQTIDAAIEDYSGRIKRQPSAENYDLRGVGWLYKKDYDSAIKDFTEAIRLEPKVPSFYENRGEARLAKGEYQSAIADLSECIRLEKNPPDLYEAYRMRAEAYDKTGNRQAAEADQREAEKYKQMVPK
jgi:tetratricopeptide (TPR) repeat protein